MGQYFQRMRMDWIAEMLRIYGFINRGHLAKKFEISIQQAANDFADFKRQNPNAMHFCTKRKAYLATPPTTKSGGE
ncbi:MAG: hypothetical protein AAF468_12505 [Pseudomonadota bacterium]